MTTETQTIIHMLILNLNDLYGLESSVIKDIPESYTRYKELSEKLIKHPLVKGVDHFITLDDITISHKKWDISEPIKLAVKYDQPLLKCQFELCGYSCYEANCQEERICIHNGCCHFFCLPIVDGELYYPSSREVLDILIKPDCLLKLMHEENLDSTPFESALTNQDLFLFFNENRVINPKYQNLINDIIAQPYHGSLAKIYLKCKAMELIVCLLRDSNLSINRSQFNLAQHDIDTLIRVRDYIAANPGATFSLRGLARQFGINDFKLKKTFKMLFQKTVFNYILEQRMQLSLQLLKNSALDLNEIAMKVGFKHQHHFAQRFKGYFGFLPSAFRKSQKV